MARRPNYRFERMDREKNKAAKRAARAQAKKDSAEQRRLEKEGGTSVSGPLPEDTEAQDAGATDDAEGAVGADT